MHGEEQNSLDVFREAIAYEQSLGTDGQPATPLNNSGEVYRELFDEERAESQWIRATSSHDGCEHVLPSLNLALLYIEQANFQAAKRAMDSFASCVAQYPLRNGEEHRALVHLIRGRLQLHTGHVEKAIKHFEEALADRQWFGKIGTSEEDLRAATMTSLAQALQRANERQAFRVGGGIGGWFDTVAARSKRTVSTWWYFRRARQILSEQLNRFEDIQIRNTDSMLEYPTLGDLLSTIPTDVLERRLAYERESDRRPEAHVFYDAYLAQNLLSQGDVARATRLLNRVSTSVRPRADELLRVQTMLQKLKLLAPGSAEYAAIAGDVFSTVRAALPSAGLRLPVNYQGSAPSLLSTLRESAFYLDNSRQYDHTVSAAIESGEFVLEFSAVNRSSGSVKVRGNDLHETVNKFTDEVFAIELQ
jgi:tetratricopeptide (TPR) repeat protein